MFVSNELSFNATTGVSLSSQWQDDQRGLFWDHKRHTAGLVLGIGIRISISNLLGVSIG